MPVNNPTPIIVNDPISLVSGELYIVNDSAGVITEIDTGVLANTDQAIPTSKAVTAAIAAGGGMSPSLAIAYAIALG